MTPKAWRDLVSRILDQPFSFTSAWLRYSQPRSEPMRTEPMRTEPMRTEPMSEPVVLRTVEDGICIITLNRPAALNALDRNLLEGLRDAVFAAEHDRGVRCVIIRGGDHFMAGGDLKWFYGLIEGRSVEEKTVLVPAAGTGGSRYHHEHAAHAEARDCQRERSRGRFRAQPDDGLRPRDCCRQRVFHARLLPDRHHP